MNRQLVWCFNKHNINFRNTKILVITEYLVQRRRLKLQEGQLHHTMSVTVQSLQVRSHDFQPNCLHKQNSLFFTSAAKRKTRHLIISCMETFSTVSIFSTVVISSRHFPIVSVESALTLRYDAGFAAAAVVLLRQLVVLRIACHNLVQIRWDNLFTHYLMSCSLC